VECEHDFWTEMVDKWIHGLHLNFDSWIAAGECRSPSVLFT
jgi:hypothetical protein